MSDSVSCARVAPSVAGDPAPASETPAPTSREMNMNTTMARVGQKAPDFAAPAYYKGDFTSVKLSDFLGKWVLLCFYPGDFTFV